MQIRKSSRGDLLTLSVEGVLDNESSIHFREAIDEYLRAGWHRILLDLSGVPYLSSAGIGTLLAARKQLDELHGLFGVWNLSPAVEQILNQTRVLTLLLCDPEKISTSAGGATITWTSEMRIFTDPIASYELYEQSLQQPFRGELIGQPDEILTGTFSENDCRNIEFPQNAFGIGLGALGTNFEMSRNRFGEFLAVGGAVAQSSMLSHGLPDFLMSQEDYVPEVQMLYGLKFSGDFSQLIRFDAQNSADPVGLSALVNKALSLSKASAAGIVILAECAGLVGARLRKSPTEPVLAAGGRFDFPEVRNWLSFCAEQVHRHSLALIVGVAQQGNQESPLGIARNLLRPMDASGQLTGHFHAAVFPYRPLKKRTLNLNPLVNELFASGTIQDVLHLLHDDRSVIGAGESTFVTGGCWVVPIGEAAMLEERT